MTEVTEAYEWRGRDVVGRDGEKIGRLEEIYLDAETGRPEWAAVNTGFLGMKQSFVPLVDFEPERGNVVVPYSKDQVREAPAVHPEDELSPEEERRLYSHYGMTYSPVSQNAPAGRKPAGDDVSGPTTDDAMTRSEEELRVGTAQRERGRVRLRKYVVTEEVQQTIPVEREEVRIERQPVTDANVDKALAGPEISDEEHEVVLHEEEVVVEKRAVPKERVRMTKDTVTDEETVSTEVRKEKIEAEGDVER
jgi:uncharacterized protein (TIGR02271 family)